jgi:outer membrane protein insertion porin family
MRTSSVIFILLAVCLSSCSIERHLPPGTQLYRGANFTIQKDSLDKTSERSIIKQLKTISAPKPNAAIFGFPYRVWFWYLIGEPKSEKGFKHWLRYRIGQEPVLSTVLNTKANAANFANHLINKGHFETQASGDTTIKGYKVEANYNIKLGMPYTINDVSWLIDTLSEIGKDINRVPKGNILVKKGEQFNLDNIKAERSRVDQVLKNRGYYYFGPDYIKAWIDSSNRNHSVNVFFKLEDDVPVAAVLPQRINTITVFPNYTLIEPPPDTSRQGMRLVNNIYVRDTVNYLNDATLVRPITYRAGNLYSLRAQNRTLTRFINTGVYKFVKNRFEINGDTLLPRKLDVYYYLTPLPQKTVQAEVGTFIKTNSFTGAQASVTWKNRNAFKGAEQLGAKAYGAVESASVDSLRRNNNFRLGAEVSLVLPRFVTPFKVRDSFGFPPKTAFTLGYEWMRRQALYTKNFFKVQYDLTWRETINKQHTLSPVSITYNTTSNFDSAYQAIMNRVPGLEISNLAEIIAGSFYNYTYRTRNPRARNTFYFSGSLDLAGNAIGLFNKVDKPYTGKVLGAYFAQYAKIDADFRYSMRISPNLTWVNRAIIGIGMPYGNSLFLPFSRQFIIGGANSLRGFEVRQLGPGRVKTTPDQQLYYPQIGGDYKLELNTEIRFPLFGKLNGAAFIDAGNIWTKDAIIYGEEAKLTSKFLNDLAVDAGFGVRLDITFLIVRFDLGVPLRVPYNERGKEWAMKDSWKNIVYNIAIGYPF